MIIKKYDIRRATTDSAGYDFKTPFAVTIRPGEKVMIDTGVKFDGTEVVTDKSTMLNRICRKKVDQWFMAIFPRSSMGMKYGMRFTNTVGIIDQDYRGSIMLEVTVDTVCSLQEGERIAQGIIIPYCVFEGEKEPKTKRTGGMGSTGKL